MFYYYAYLEKGICTDIERTKKQKTDLTDYVEVSQAEYDAYMNDETTSEHYIIGKKWNGSEWIVPKKFCYAVLNEKNIVIDHVASDEEIVKPNYISITEDAYKNRIYLHQKWDVTQERFVEVPFSQYADTDTTNVSVNGTNTPLQTLLEGMQKSLENVNCTMSAADILKALVSVDGSGSGLDADTLDGNDSSVFAKVAAVTELSNVVAGKAPSNHTHSGYATTTELNNGLAGKANASHAHPELATAAALASGLASKENGVVFGEYTGTAKNGEDGSQHITLGFRPKAVLVCAFNGSTFETQRMTRDGRDVLVNVHLGGFYIDGINSDEYFGCEIDDTGFTLLSKWHNDYEAHALNEMMGVYMAFK